MNALGGIRVHPRSSAAHALALALSASVCEICGPPLDIICVHPRPVPRTIEDLRLKITRLDAIAPESVSHNPRIIKRVMLRRGDVPRVTQFAQARLAPGEVAPVHSHADMLEVFFVEAGEGKVTVDGVPHRIDAGCCVAVEPGESHEIESTGDADLVLTYFGVAD